MAKKKAPSRYSLRDGVDPETGDVLILEDGSGLLDMGSIPLPKQIEVRTYGKRGVRALDEATLQAMAREDWTN